MAGAVLVLQGFPGFIVPGVEFEPALFPPRGRIAAERPGDAIAADVRWRKGIERFELLRFRRAQSDQYAAPLLVDGVAPRQKLRCSRGSAVSGSGSVETAFQDLRHRNPQ